MHAFTKHTRTITSSCRKSANEVRGLVSLYRVRYNCFQRSVTNLFYSEDIIMTKILLTRNFDEACFLDYMSKVES